MLPTPLSQVLFVDDDEDAGEMLSQLLKPYRIELTCALSSADAWLKIKAKCFDLYLLDAWLPEVDGFELCRQIREGDKRTPVLFYSGAAYDADKKKAFTAGADAYVTKPDIEGLIGTMTGLIAQARAHTFAASQAVVPSRSAGNWLSSQASQVFAFKTATE